MWIRGQRARSPDRRILLAGLAALAGCASADHPISGYVFSLTAWASGETVDFLLLDITDDPIRIIEVLPAALRVEVLDQAGNSLTGGYVPLFPDAPPPNLSVKRARRLASQKAAKASLSARQLAEALAGRLALDPTQSYRIGFEVYAPVIGPGGQVLTEQVRTRSVCDLSFRDGRPRMDCRSPY